MIGRGSRLRTVSSIALGALSALFGIVMTAPSVWSYDVLSYPSVGVSEWPWLPIGTGLAAIGLSRKADRRRVGGWLGLFGLTLALRPLWQLGTTSRRHDAAMQEVLGADYEQQLSPESLVKTTRARLGFAHSARRRRLLTRQVRITPDIPFHVIGDHALYADLYQPIHNTRQHPAVISIHGGGWHGGDKGERYAAHCRWLASQGYVVLDVQYRLSPQSLWPAHLEDVKTAIRWLRANAEQYQVDPERIALIGRSAGGHLALMAAFTAGDPAFPPPPGLPERDDVQAVIGIYPPTDLPLLQKTVYTPLNYWLGSTIAERPDLYIAASPLYKAKASAPPVLLAHGGFDNLVTPEHSARLHKRLGELGVPSVLLYYPWARHGFDFALSGLGGHMLQYDTDRFLAWALRR